MDKRGKSIWIDLDNSPHVPLFVPVIGHYRESGVNVMLTARNHSQTIELLELSGLEDSFTVVGTHAGASRIRKAANLLGRAVNLVRHVRRHAMPSVAVSHGSRSMVLAAKVLRIPVITMYDYEFTETRIFNTFSDRVLVPDGIDDEILDDIGLSASKRYKYPGLKEELYIRRFAPASGFLSDLSRQVGTETPPERALVLLRPPATTANYHDSRSDSIFAALLDHLNDSNAFTIIVPRTKDQAEEIEARIASMKCTDTRSVILRSAVSGLDLINAADLVISGGGTMNREAVLLGVPVYSIFQGEQGSLDRGMEQSGKIVFIRSEADMHKIRVEKRGRSATRAELSDRVEQFVRKHIDFFVATGPKR